jgi:DNA-binding LacI/PurR family transcriptional regulator
MSDRSHHPPATIYDVAERAGVSISTVSLAINNPQRVRAATRERIHGVIDELGYAPKTDAVARARRGVGRIGVVAPFSSHPSFSLRLNGVFGAASDRSLEILVYDEASAADSLLSSLPVSRRVDGMIVMGLPFSDEVAARLHAQHIATVLVELRRPGFNSVAADDHHGGVMAGEHLVAAGHQRFAFVGQRQRIAYASPSERRLAGFREAVRAGGHVLGDDQVRRVDHTLDAARIAALELLEQPNAPSAIFAYDDALAGGVLRAAHERGLRVPEDLAVVGFDDSELAQQLGLTSIHQPFAESGAAATEALLALLADPSRPPRHVSLELTLVARDTT